MKGVHVGDPGNNGATLTRRKAATQPGSSANRPCVHFHTRVRRERTDDHNQTAILSRDTAEGATNIWINTLNLNNPNGGYHTPTGTHIKSDGKQKPETSQSRHHVNTDWR